MKRGWITWDKTEIPPSAFESRLAVVRQQLEKKDLSALVVYTDVWRSNQGRYLSNFMPYWNRALLVIPYDSAPVLLCGLSPRVYPWIRSVTILEDIRPHMNLKKMRDENGWGRIGVLDLLLFPHDFFVDNLVNVRWNAIHPEPDEAELSMYRRAAKMAREILKAEIPVGLDHEYVGRLERAYRRAGAEDLVVLVTNGDTAPQPPKGLTLGATSSISIAMEYRGHWVKIVGPGFQRAAGLPPGVQILSGPYPYEYCRSEDLEPGSIFAAINESTVDGKRIFQGDTYRLGPNGPELL